MIKINRTIKEYLSTLPEPYSTLAIDNSPVNQLDVYVDSLSEAVLRAFHWDISPEGESFWDEIYYIIEEMEHDLYDTCAELELTTLQALSNHDFPPVPNGQQDTREIEYQYCGDEPIIKTYPEWIPDYDGKVLLYDNSLDSWTTISANQLSDGDIWAHLPQ